jgi:hypothetical protein
MLIYDRSNKKQFVLLCEINCHLKNTGVGDERFFCNDARVEILERRVKKGRMSKTLPRRLLKKTFVQSAENQDGISGLRGIWDNTYSKH